MKKCLLIAMASLTMSSFVGTGTAQAQKWADLTMTFVLDGDVPARKPLDMTRDPKCPSQPSQLGDELIVDPKTKGIANLVLMVDTRKNKLEANSIHPDLKEIPKSAPVLDNVDCKFVPHVLTMRAGQKIEVKNSDPTGHNANFGCFENPGQNPLIQPNSSKVLSGFDLEEKSAVPVECTVHGWMKAYVVILAHPYAAVSDGQGKLTIEKLPAGVELDFRIWHESQDKSIEEMTIGGKTETWKKGVTKLTLREGTNDLGKVMIKANRFKK
jgi:plastocyanin